MKSFKLAFALTFVMGVLLFVAIRVGIREASVKVNTIQHEEQPWEDLRYSMIEVNKKAEACGLKVTITDMHFAVLRLGELLFDSMELYDVNVFLDGYTEGEKWARQ